ncbi:TRAP-type C4-dicarboxylate transporter small permease [Pusillimonas sp. T7-7]|uniref:TRAP transporter small permease n=1 Tax=Pusillimonas sp. (strain T7-7) TaxID=1007105 RepID=UPI00020849C4|nr:TRAP transporter small permease [Pusillimonas sp. T7-7]AEC19346.1 TRAP-type C4-dicarboxylate transporter small permease [Pusillimonas sp. T7-7]
MKAAWHERLEEGLIALLLASMTLVTFGQVIARYVFNYSFVWALELSTFLFGGLIFLGISYGVRVNAHIGVDALVKILPKSLSHALSLIAAALCLLYTVIVLTGSWVYVSKMYEIGILAQDIPIYQWIPRMVMPIGFILLLFRFGQILFKLIKGKEAHLLGDEAEDALKYSSDETLPTTQDKP